MIWHISSESPIRINVKDQASLIDDAFERLTMNQGFSVATLNLDHVVKLRKMSDFAGAYAAHSHVSADGKPIVWLSALSGSPVALVAGSELIEPMVSRAAEKGIPIGLFGASQIALDGAANALGQCLPDLQLAFKQSPPMGFDPNGSAADEAIRQIGQSGARLVFLALGAPKQEIFAARAQAALPNVGFVSIGAGLDFIAGTQTRAPRWVRAIAAEWLWRMFREPRRLAGRYAACLAILPSLMLQAVRTRFSGR